MCTELSRSIFDIAIIFDNWTDTGEKGWETIFTSGKCLACGMCDWGGANSWVAMNSIVN